MRRSLPSTATACALLLASVGACVTEPAPLGEAVIVVQTDVAIPRYVSRLRVDLHGDDGALLQSRELSAPRQDDWPISFSVVADREEERFVLVRLRAYPEGHTLTRAEIEALRAASFAEPVVHGSLEDACRDAPALRLGEPVTLRRGSRPITSVLPFTPAGGAATCTRPTGAGSVAAKLVVTEPDAYRVEIVSAVPDGARGEPGGDTTLAIRTDCRLATTQLACDDDGGAGGGGRLSRVTANLAPGTYWIVTGGEVPAPADLTILATQVNTVVPVKPPAPPVADAAAIEPSPGATIDRLVRVRLVPGERGTVRMTLFGECFGAAADVARRETCVDTAGVRIPAETIYSRGRLSREAAPPPPWRGQAEELCTALPRAPREELDGEVCIPGGAMLMGDTLALGDVEYKSQPERMRVVAPFLLDTHEVTVGRFRDAVARGLVPIPGAVRPNNVPLTKDDACTWNEGATPTVPAPGVDRERLPLTCVTWPQARAVCKFLGGDLPTEDQWEYAATTAGRTAEAQFPWGDELPDCARAVVERSISGFANRCKGVEVGPVAVDDERFADRDVTALGVRGLGGNVQEWLATGFYPYGHAAWERAGLRQPMPAWADEEAPLRATRGGDWATFALYTSSSARRSIPPVARYDNVGFRCARPGR